MRWLSLIVITYSIPTFASDWNDLLHEFSRIGSGQAGQVCSQNTADSTPLICSKPYEVICHRPQPDLQAETKQTFQRFQKKMGSDPLKASFEAISSAQEKFNQSEHTYSDAWSQFREPLDAQGIPDQEVQSKGAADPKLQLLKKEIDQRQSELDALLKKHDALIAELTRQILAQYQKTPEDLQKLFDQIKASVIRSADKYLPDTAPNPDWAKKGDAVRFLKTVKIVVTSAYDHNYGQFRCGYNGLTINASYNSEERVVQVCPGMLIAALANSGGSLESLGGVLAHEFGHSIDGRGITTPCDSGECNLSFDYAYRTFLDCIQKHYASDPSQNFVSDADFAARLKKSMPEFEQACAKLPPDSPRARQLAAMAQWFKQNADSLSSSDKMGNQKRSELAADFYFANELADQMQSMPKEKRISFIQRAFPMFCNSTALDPLLEKLMGDSDPAHPPSRFRIEQALRHPEIRQLLGCAPLKSNEQPWCPLASKSH